MNEVIREYVYENTLYSGDVRPTITVQAIGETVAMCDQIAQAMLIDLTRKHTDWRLRSVS